MITIDDRTQLHQPQFQQAFRAALGAANVEVKRMKFSDIAFQSQHEYHGKIVKVGIEHATISDYLGKIDSGRLAFQLNGMRQNFDISILLVEGSVIRNRETGNVKLWGQDREYDWERWQGARFSIEMHGVRFWSESTRKDAAARIIAWYRWWQKRPDEHKLLQPRQSELSHSKLEETDGTPDFSVSPGSPLDRATVAIADLVQTMGTKRAEAALRKYGRLDVLVVQPESELAKIDGWGPVMAKRFRESVTRVHFS